MMPAEPLPAATVAILGAGRVGTVLARSLVDTGVDVRVVGSQSPEDIRLIVDIVAPGARALAAHEAIPDADVVIIAVPLHKIDTVDARLFEGKIVVDVMNYWEPIDGHLADFTDAPHGTSLIIAQKLKGARLVKAFNHIGYHDIESDRRPSGATDRRALAVASDDAQAAATVMNLIDRIGFDPLYAGTLKEGKALEAGGEIFGVRYGKAKLAALLSSSRR